MIIKADIQINADQTAIWSGGRVTHRISYDVPKQDPCNACAFRKVAVDGACNVAPCCADERIDCMDGIWEVVV